MGILRQRMVEQLTSHRAVAAFVVAVVFTLTSTLSVVFRLIAVRIKRRKLGPEDYAILAAQVTVYAMAVCVLLEVFIGGAGRSAPHVSRAEVTTYLKILVALQIFYGTSLGLIKTSMCLFYIRIFFVRSFRIAARIVIALTVAWSTMVVLTAFLLCKPLAFNWDPATLGGSCANQPAAFIAIGALDLIMDCMVLCLPLPMIWNLQISQPHKIGLSAIFGLGIFTMIISILRITSLLSVSYTDITNTSASALLWSFLEPAIGITVACAPLMRPLFDKSPLSRKHRSRPGKNGGSSSFERLGEPGHSLNEFERTGASMVTSCGTGDGRGRGDGDEDGQALGEAGGRTGKGSAGIRVQREFYTQ